jgi:glycosyltransferase involved in cell wall biosynthesis
VTQNRKILVIAPCRNEEKYLPDLVEGMLQQTLVPAEWIIVDDGSSDRTADIVRNAEARAGWIKLTRRSDRGSRSVGPGVVEAFYHGLEQSTAGDWDYICKLDADITLPPRYFETLVEYFEKDPRLGQASGKLFMELGGGRLVEERTADEMVWGCANFFRRACFEAVGGFVREVMWDGIVFHRARMEGWRTRSIRDPRLRIIDRRQMGSSDRNVFFGRRRWGRGQYFMGTHPLYILAIGAYRLAERPFLLGGLNIVLGYVTAALRGVQRYEHPGFRESLHAWQFERLRLGRRREIIAAPPEGLYPDA